MKLSAWAKTQGISYRSAWRWFTNGTLPVEAEQTSTGTILVKEGKVSGGKVAIYARVSSSDQKKDLESQICRLALYASTKKWTVTETIAEIGSGLNGYRPKLKKLLMNSQVDIILVEHPDRLVRFGFEYIESALSTQGRRILVVDKGELKDDLVTDMIEVLTSFCERLYGRRSAKNRAKKAVEAIQSET